MKESIMSASMKLMQKKDFNSITVREIAAEANVNVAAINYYFGGKTQLFHELMANYWAQMMDIYRAILSEPFINTEKAILYSTKILRIQLQSTGVLRSEQVMYQQYGIDVKTQERIQMQFKAIGYLVTQLHPGLSGDLLFSKSLILLSSLNCPGFWSDLTSQYVSDLDSFIPTYIKEVIHQI